MADCNGYAFKSEKSFKKKRKQKPHTDAYGGV